MTKDTVAINRLDDKLIELAKTLYLLKSTLDVYKLICLNAAGIKRTNVGRRFFGHLQDLSLESYVLGICKVFEQPTPRRRHELHSLCAVLGEAGEWPLLSEGPLKDFAAQYGATHQSQVIVGPSLLEDMSRIYGKFVRQHSKELDRLRRMRDKVIAHSEYLEPAKRPESLPSYDLMENLLLFAVDLHSAISRAYLNVLPHAIRREGRVAASLHSTLQRLGMNTVETKFDDDE